MEPISMIVTAIALGAAAGLKPTVQQAVQDAYAGLKAYLKRRYQQVSVDQLEADPKSAPRRSMVEEDLQKADASKDAELLGKAKQVIDAVRQQAPEAAAAIGVELEDIEGASLTIERILATGAGVRVKKAKVTGDIAIRDVKAGKKSRGPSKKE
jgi:hypothetical protein